MTGPLARLNARTPLSVRLVVVLVSLMALGLVVAGAAAVAALRGYLIEQVDQSLRDLAHQFSSSREEPGMVAPPPGGSDGDDGPGPPSDFYLRFASPDGTVLGVVSNPLSTSQGTPDLPAWTLAQVQEQGDAPFTVTSVGGGAHWRVAASVTPSGATVMVAQSLAPVEATVRQLIIVELAVGGAVVALLAVLAYALVRRSLRPLRDVERTAGAIASGDLSHRVPETDPRTEVGRLGRAFNAMLAQIEHAFAVQAESEASARESERRMRRFVADASHELRTPLTSIRGFAELYRQGALPDRAGVDRAMTRIEGEAARMGLLVEDMLTLARRDQQRALAREPVDLLALATDAVHDARAAAPDRRITLALAPRTQPPVVLGDEPSLRQVLANLVGNALAHTPAGTPVEVRLDTRSEGADQRGWAVLEVADAGPGLPPDAAARVFERFYRADDARNRADGGSGLGLAIVDALVAAHDGRVELDTAEGNGATFRVLLPLAATP